MSNVTLYALNGQRIDLTAPDRNELLTEVATRATAGGFGFGLGDWLGALPDPDPVLNKRGDSAAVLNELMADNTVTESVIKRKYKTLNKKGHTFSPGALDGHEVTAKARQLCDDLAKDLERVDLYNKVIPQVLDAPYFGFTPVEIAWRAEGGKMRIADLEPKPRDWFAFDSENKLTYPAQSPDAQPVNPHKVVLVRHFPTYENPYGLRLLSRCLWPVAFKRGGVEFWLKFAEKFGFPHVVAKAHQNASEAERNRMAASLAAMVQDAVAVLTAGSEVQLHEAGGKGGDIHYQLVVYWDKAISRLITGQTLTGDIGSSGSYAAAKTHADVLEDYAEADERTVVTFFNDLARVYALVNAADTLSPVFSFVEPEDLLEKTKLDLNLQKLGVVFTRDHFRDRYRLQDDAYVLKGEKEKEEPTPKSSAAELAAPAEETEPHADPRQAELDALADELLEEGLGIVDPDTLAWAIDNAESFEDAFELLAELLEDDPEAETTLNRVLTHAAMLGYEGAQADMEDDDG